MTAEPQPAGRRPTVAYLALRLTDIDEDALANVRRQLEEGGGSWQAAGTSPAGVEATFSRVSAAVTAALAVVETNKQAKAGVHAGELPPGEVTHSSLATTSRAARDAASPGTVLVTDTVRSIAAK